MVKYQYMVLGIILVIVLSFIVFKDDIMATKVSSKKRVIVIDAGHGGKDPGTSYGLLKEKDIVLAISKVLYNTLKEKYEVYLIRDGDFDLSSPKVNYRKRSDFDNRIRFIKSAKADLYLSIHLNFYVSSYYYGAQVFYDDINDNNKVLAKLIQDKLNIDYSNRSIKELRNLYLYKNIDVPGVLIECGFISNANDRYRLQNPEHQRQMSVNIMMALEEYFH